MGRNQRETTAGNQEEAERCKPRDQRRQTRDLWKCKSRLVLRRLTAPFRPGIGGNLTMVTAVMVSPAMEIERTCVGFFPIDIAGGMDDARRQSNPDQEGGQQYHRA